MQAASWWCLAGLDIPLTPGCDDGNVGAEVLESELETNLVVALTGAAVSNSVSAFLLGDFNDTLCDYGAGERGAQQILFVLGAGLESGEDILVNELVGEVFDVELGSAGFESLFFQTVKLVALTNVSGYGDNFTAVVLLQPGDNDGGIETTGISEYALVDFFHSYSFLLNCCLSIIFI